MGAGLWVSFFFQAEDGIRDYKVTGVQTCALPICEHRGEERPPVHGVRVALGEHPGGGDQRHGLRQLVAAHLLRGGPAALDAGDPARSEEHTSELQSPCNLVCRLLLEKKKTFCSQSIAPSFAPPAGPRRPPTSSSRSESQNPPCCRTAMPRCNPCPDI